MICVWHHWIHQILSSLFTVLRSSLPTCHILVMRRSDRDASATLGSSGRLCKSLMMVTATSIKPNPRLDMSSCYRILHLKLAKFKFSSEACKPHKSSKGVENQVWSSQPLWPLFYCQAAAAKVPSSVSIKPLRRPTVVVLRDLHGSTLQQWSGWPLVGNEGINLYIGILGIHSLIPY